MIKILYGNEPYRLDYERKKVVSSVSNPAMNYQRFTGSFTDEALEACNTFPFFEEKRVVFLDIETLKKGLDTDAFKKYLKKPSDTTELLIICRKVDKREKLFKSLKDYMVPCDKVTSVDELKKVVLCEVKRCGAKITEGALNEFIERLNYFSMENVTLLMAKDYIECLAAVSLEITADMVSEFVPKFEDADVFSLAGLIKSPDAGGLLKQLNMLTKDKAIPTLSALLWSFRVAYKEKMFSLSEIGSKPSAFEKYPAEKLNKAIKILTDRIAQIKSGFMPDEVALKATVAELMAIL